jgi:streptomycin 3"-adenylyltransferase
VTPAAEEYLAALVRVVRVHLGDGLIGAYLHGSAVLGGWDPERSDIDVLAVDTAPVAPEVLRDLAEAVSVRALPCPVQRGLELGLVTAESAAAPCAEPRFELDLTTSDGDGDRPTLGGDRPGHADYLMHFAVCRGAGRALAGPAPAEVFGPAPVELLDAAFADELAWAADHAPPAYRVLNACRAWCFASERRLVSKVEGGGWALGRGVSVDAIRAALAEQAGGPEVPIDAAAIAALLARATAELDGASRYPAG